LQFASFPETCIPRNNKIWNFKIPPRGSKSVSGSRPNTVADRGGVKKSIRKDKRDYIDSLAKQAEEAAGKGNMKELYMATKKLSNNFQKTKMETPLQQQKTS